MNYEKAEKLILQEQADAVLAYCSISNAEKLYPLADATQRLFLFADAGMQLSESAPAAYAYHISLQGIHACRLAGFLAGEKSRKVLMAVSYYDGGYKGPWECFRGLLEAGGSVCGNYISDYKEKGIQYYCIYAFTSGLRGGSSNGLFQQLPGGPFYESSEGRTARGSDIAFLLFSLYGRRAIVVQMPLSRRHILYGSAMGFYIRESLPTGIYTSHQVNK
ncbi:MAG: hypothetical protein WDO19_15000 [Bacteroidota bacterium]